jgi:hypothetical protein
MSGKMTKPEYNAAMSRIDEIFDADPGTEGE